VVAALLVSNGTLFTEDACLLVSESIYSKVRGHATGSGGWSSIKGVGYSLDLSSFAIRGIAYDVDVGALHADLADHGLWRELGGVHVTLDLKNVEIDCSDAVSELDAVVCAREIHREGHVGTGGGKGESVAGSLEVEAGVSILTSDSHGRLDLLA